MKWSAAALAAVLLALVPATARAATYDVQLCAEPQATGFAEDNPNPQVLAVTVACPASETQPYSGVFVGVRPGTTDLTRGTMASWTLTAPSGIAFKEITVQRRLQKSDRTYEIAIRADGSFVDGCVAGVSCREEVSTRTYDLSRELKFSVRCVAERCGRSTQGSRAWIAIEHAVATVDDPAVPTVAALAPGWRRTPEVTVSATDVSGIASLELRSGDRVLGRTAFACDYRFLQPCRGTGTTTVNVDLPDGSHAVTVRATDAARQTATSTGTLRIDRTAPASPQGVTVQATGSGTYTYTWTNPDQGAASPIVAAHLSDGTVVKGANIQSLESASPDERIYLEDEAGNADAATAVGTAGPSTGASGNGGGGGSPLQLNPPILQTTTKPKIKLSSAKRQGTRLVVKGTVTNATASKIIATVKRGSRTVRKSANVTRGRFTIRIALNSSMRRKGTVSLTVRHGTAKATKRVRV